MADHKKGTGLAKLNILSTGVGSLILQNIFKSYNKPTRQLLLSKTVNGF